ncbi:MAG TPA: hypothetical protein VKA84_08100 [Gemmatimonadaceae bacterium]|nr:hypothetical protein [Gemmatimonadaceae bacterium]
MGDDRKHDPDARTRFLTRLIRRGPAAAAPAPAPASVPDLPAKPEPMAVDPDQTQLIDQSQQSQQSQQSAEAKPAAEAPNRSSVLGGAKSTKGTMFGQMYSPFAITQEVIKKPGPPAK